MTMQNDDGCTIEEAAALSFEPLVFDKDRDLDGVNRNIESFATFVRVALDLLALDKAELVEVIKKSGADIAKLTDEFTDYKDWINGAVEAFSAVEARLLVAAAVLAQEPPAVAET